MWLHARARGAHTYLQRDSRWTGYLSAAAPSARVPIQIGGERRESRICPSPRAPRSTSTHAAPAFGQFCDVQGP